jgi:hypothetical protein
MYDPRERSRYGDESTGWIVRRSIPCRSKIFFFISGFRCDVDVICGLLGNYTASCGNYLPTFRDNV